MNQINKVEGKTKTVQPFGIDPQIGYVVSKDDVTAGDGKRHDVLFGKGELSNRTTCNVFEFLADSGIPLAYIGKEDHVTFIAWICKMIPVEVVVRTIATGSYLKRNPEVKEGSVFETPVVEFFYKTTGRKFGDRDLPCDDPLMIFDDANTDGFYLYNPNKPISSENIIGHSAMLYSLEDFSLLKGQLDECETKVLAIGLLLQEAWDFVEGYLYDFKVEFGIHPVTGEIVLADVIDCDSWRVMWHNLQLSKQPYRDGRDADALLEVYRLAATLTDRFPKF